MAGFAVVDVETTGLNYERGARILEIGVVLLDENGEQEGTWETLINPGDAVGPTMVHGITAPEVLGAPRFEEVAPTLLRLLAGRVFVAHNTNFDAGFILHQLREVGMWPAATLPVIDTLLLARQRLPVTRHSLAHCCSHLGIRNPRSHTGITDALATAELLSHFLDTTPAPRVARFGIDRRAKEEYPQMAAGAECRTRTREEAYVALSALREAAPPASGFAPLEALLGSMALSPAEQALLLQAAPEEFLVAAVDAAWPAHARELLLSALGVA